jgi:Fe-S-cluster containining protein
MESIMPERFDFDAYARQVRAVSGTLICPGRKIAEISGRMHLLTVAAERDLLRFGEPSEMSRVACGPGCGACCVLNVSVLFPEAIAIAWYLERSLTEKALDEVLSRLHELLITTRWLDDEERLFLREACAFLDRKGLCMIHKARPLLCRAITSTNPSACREAIAMAALDGPPTVEMNLFQKNLFDAVYQGLGAALRDSGLDHRPRRLTSTVLALHSDSDLVGAFAAGERIPLH